MKLKIEVINPVFSKILDGQKIVEQYLSYEYEYWIKTRFRKERRIKRKSMIKNGYCFTGFIPKITSICSEKNIELEIINSIKYIHSTCNPNLDKINFRQDQLNLIQSALEKQRGVIKAPTGIGKTILALGIMSCFRNLKVLFLCNERTLLKQTVEEMKDKGFTNISIYGDSKKESFNNIVVGLIQSVVKLDPNVYSDYFDIVIVDECDIGMDIDSQYYKVLKNIQSKLRFGFTATLPNKESSKLVLEGLIGPVIGEMDIIEGINLELLAKPVMKFIKVPFSHEIRELKSYKTVYENGIVNNRSRNRLLLKEVRKYVDENKSILILVTRIDHGHNIVNLAKTVYDLKIPFVHGNTESDERIIIKQLLQNKTLKVVVANAVWTRGINIPSLDVLINAAGEKSEVSVLQRIGRGLRKTKEKDKVIIVDFFDLSHHYLTNHIAERLSLYSEMNWL